MLPVFQESGGSHGLRGVSIWIFGLGLALGWGASWFLAHRELKVNRSIIAAVKDATITEDAKRQILAHALPQRGLLKWLFQSLIILLALIALFAGAAAVILRMEMPSASDIAKEIRGGESIGYWYADLNAPRDSDGGFPRVVVCGSVISVVWWVYHLGAEKDPYSEEYKNSPYRNLSGGTICLAPGFVIYSPTIKPGSYGIDFSGTNDRSWRETLTITETDTEVVEKMEIMKEGKQVPKQEWHLSK